MPCNSFIEHVFYYRCKPLFSKPYKADRKGKISPACGTSSRSRPQRRRQTNTIEQIGGLLVKGDSDVLRLNLMKDAGRVAADFPAGYQAHHLLPSQVTAEFSAVFRDAAQHGYDINAACNGLILPATADLAKLTGLPLHSGAHPEYTAVAREMLVEVQALYQAGSLTAKELPAALQAVQRDLQQKILRREVFLNKNDPARIN